ncbi:MAG: cobyrinate a,c-diamide synthase [Nitrospiraceae bacterium]|nr:cobyrinate a,c-diamide synthase [Nitrospiraceae bacterium]
MRQYPRVVVAGLSGGSGKTTLSLGLIRAFRKKGLSKTLAFKKGPDYIDAAWLGAASGGPCYNLDPFLIGRENILRSFTSRSAGFDISLIEGNRGLFDGMDLKGSQSTATLAGILKAPVVLIMDVSKMTRTAAAIVLGMKNFEPGLELAGVVLNRVAGARHESMLRQSIEHYTGVPVLGALPKMKDRKGKEKKSSISERHMGLLALKEHPEAEAALDRACELVEKSVNVEAVIEAARRAPRLKAPAQQAAGKRKSEIVIGVIQDRAFQFYYPENLEALERSGAALEMISPLSEKTKGLPDIHALYIGGGFPETNAIPLSKNKAFLRSLKEKIEQGLPVYAECGGLMYLASNIEVEGAKHPMAGIFPFGMTLEKRPVAHGYSIARIREQNAFYPAGTVLKGHEFHYSRPQRIFKFKTSKKKADNDQDVRFALEMERGTGIENGLDGLVYKNVFATYTHTHALGTPEWVRGIMKAAEKFRKENG